MSKPISDVTQVHSGDGDNVAGDKIIKSSINARLFYEPISEVLALSRKRKFDDCFKKLEILEATSSLESCAQQLLKVCKIHVSLQRDCKNTEITQAPLLQLANSEEELIKDLAISSLMRLEVRDDRHADAERRFTSLSENYQHSKETFFELIAPENQITDYFDSNQLSLTEQELCGLIRGAIRLKTHSLSEKIGNYLVKISPDVNSAVLVALARVSALNDDLIGKHYWSINSKSRKELIAQCQLFQELLENTDGKDKRVVGQASALADYTLGEYKPLIDTLWKYNSAVSEVAPDTSRILNYTYQEIAPEDKHPITAFSKALKDPAYKEELIKTLTQSRTLSSNDSQILIKLGDSSSINRWLEAGGQITSEVEIEKDILNIEIRVLSALVAEDEDEENKIKISRDIDQFLVKHRNEIQSLNLVNIIEMVDQLISIGLPDSAANLTKFFVPDTDIWLSPLTQRYLRALLKSDQYMTLAIVLSELNDDWDINTWHIKVQQLASQHKYSEAVEAATEAIKLKADSPYSWNLLLSCHIANKSDEAKISDTLRNIPTEVFAEPSDYGYWLLHVAALHGNFELTERIVLRWFRESPENNAIQLTNLHFGFAIGKIEKELVAKNELDNCIGVSFEIEGQQHLKLICNSSKTANSHIIDADSYRGKLLLSMAEGDTVIEGINEVKLLKKLPPYQTAVKIATDIRTAINDGSDCFQKFNVPSAPDEMFDTIEKKVSLANRGTDHLKNLDIPLYMKGARYGRHDPVSAAITLFTDPAVEIQPLPSFGQSLPPKIIIDIYGACYLSLVGAVDALLHSDIEIVMTIETKALIQSWIDDVNREDYLALGVDSEGRLFRNTHEDMKAKTSGLQGSFNKLTSHADSPELKLVDYPAEISKITDLVDLSVMSSMKMSIANSIPWFCVDLTFARVAQHSGHDVVNCAHFLSSLLAETPLNLKIDGLFVHLHCQFPYILSFSELIQLANSHDEGANELLLALLKKHQVPELPLELAAQFLSNLWLMVLLKATDGRHEKVEDIFYQCCCNLRLCDNNKEAEYKVALMLQHCFTGTSKISGLMRVVHSYAAKYISGQFMSFERVNEHLKTMATESSR